MSLTVKVMIAMVAGLVLGIILNTINNDFLNTHLVGGLLDMIGKMFVNALKMLVVPLVTFSLIVGVTGIGDIAALGRMGTKAFGLYVMTTAIAIATAITLAILIGPGAGFDAASVSAADVTARTAETPWQVFANIVPTNPINAFADGNMLQIIFYVILVGVAALMLGEVSKPFVQACEYMNELMMKVVSIVMNFAPYGVFCLIAEQFAKDGFGLFLPLLSYVFTLVGALAFHLLITLMLVFMIFTKLSPLTLLKKIRPAQIFAFSTASSNATIPVTFRSVTQRVGVSNSVASFTVPLGATINMDGTAIMQGVATVFIANVSGVELGLGGYLTVIMMSVLASIGTAGVPGVGMVMLTMVLTQVGLPIEAVGLLLGVDRLMDMIRTMVNVSGDAVVSSIVAQGEGQLDESVFHDPDAGVLDGDELHIDHEAELALQQATK